MEWSQGSGVPSDSGTGHALLRDQTPCRLQKCPPALHHLPMALAGPWALPPAQAQSSSTGLPR